MSTWSGSPPDSSRKPGRGVAHSSRTRPPSKRTAALPPVRLYVRSSAGAGAEGDPSSCSPIECDVDVVVVVVVVVAMVVGTGLVVVDRGGGLVVVDWAGVVVVVVADGGAVVEVVAGPVVPFDALRASATAAADNEAGRLSVTELVTSPTAAKARAMAAVVTASHPKRSPVVRRMPSMMPRRGLRWHQAFTKSWLRPAAQWLAWRDRGCHLSR